MLSSSMGYLGKLTWAVLALAAFCVTEAATRWGIGISPDSIVYIGGARSLLEGRGFSMSTTINSIEPITYFAPFYSVVLAGVGLTGLDPMVVSKWVNGGMFSANILIVCFLIAYCLKEYSLPYKLILPVVGGWLVLTSPSLIEIHAMAWSESLFILLGCSGIYFMAKYLEEASGYDLFASSVLISLAILTRYAGIVLPITGGLALLLFGSKTWLKRISDAILFGVASLFPLGIWLLRNWMVARTATGREIQFHPVGKIQAQQALATFSSWLLIPENASGWLKLVAVLVLFSILAVGILWKPHRRHGLPRLIKILAIYVLISFGFLLFSISFIDANTPLDNRILSPIYVSVLILLMISVGGLIQGFFAKNGIKVILIGAITILSFTPLVPAAHFVSDAYRNGLGFNSVTWRQSETLASVARLPKGIPIYSNAPEAIFVQTNRPSDRLPSKFQSANLQVNPNYLSELANLNALLRSRHGVVVYFDAVQRSTLPTVQELVKELKLRPVSQTSDGTILGP